MGSTKFPSVGKTYEADYGDWCIRLHFLSEQYAQVTSMTTGHSETVEIFIILVRAGLFLVQWQEEDSTVVQVQDYDNDTVFTISTFHRITLRRQGTWREVSQE